MKDLVGQFLGEQITRRQFTQALAALGISAAGVQSVVQAAEAVAGTPGVSGHSVTGTGGELMVAQMKAAGVRFLFTNPGSFERGFFDAFLENEQTQLIMGLHEGIVISMADGYHKVSGEPAFVNVHVMAGTAQASGQLYNSSRDGSSLIVTAGLLDNELMSDDVLLGARPGFDQKDVNRQFTKISWESHDAGSIPTQLRRAFKVAATDPGGPVYLAFPDYVLEKKDVTARVYSREQFMLPNSIPPNADHVKQVAELLIEAKNPMMHLGDEVTKSSAQPEVLELAELLGITVANRGLPAYHNFPRRHELYAGGFSSRGKDFILNVGAPDKGGGTVPVQAHYDDGTTVVSIGLNTNAMGRTHPFHFAMIANPKLALRALIEEVKAATTKERRDKIIADRPKRRNRQPQIDKANIGASPIHPDELGFALEEELDKNAIVVSENLSGSNQFYSTGHREDEKMWVSTSGAGLGWSVGAATGAKLAAPDRQVVCNIGDGALMYSASGFWSQARYETPVLTVVCNNKNYQTVRNAYVRYNGAMKKSNKFTGMYLGDPDIDFAKLAESQGLEAATVENAADLRPAIKRGIAATRAGQPYLIDVRVQRRGGGADSTWHQAFSLAKERTRKV